MSRVLDVAVRPMRFQDIDAVLTIEKSIYDFPWTLGNFRDCLDAGYSCWVLERGGRLVAYAVLMIAAQEAHLLNLCVARAQQGQGLGREFMDYLIRVARTNRAENMFLEVRPSNAAGRRLYESLEFNEYAVRRAYYPARGGREDAILMGRAL